MPGGWAIKIHWCHWGLIAILMDMSRKLLWFPTRSTLGRRGVKTEEAVWDKLCEYFSVKPGETGMVLWVSQGIPKPQFPWTPCYPVYKKNCLNLLKPAVSCRWWQGKYYWGLEVSIALMPWNITETNIWDCQPITFTAEILFSPGQFILSHSLLPN